MKNKYLFILGLSLWLIFAAIPTQAEREYLRDESVGLPNFNLDAIAFLSEDPMKTHVVIYVEIMYDNLQFLQSARGFEGNYEVDLSILAGKDENSLRYTNQVWRSTVMANSFEDTNSRNRFDVSVTELDLPAGDYYVIATLVDLESKRKSESKAALNVPSFNRPEMQVGDLLLAKNIRIAQDGMYEIVPNVDKVIREFIRPMYVYFEVYPRDASLLQVYSRILDSQGEVVYDSSYSIYANSPITRDYFSVDLSNFKHGVYVVEVQVKAGKMSALRSAQFKVLLAGLPGTVTDLDAAIEQLRYLASRKELKVLKFAKPFKKEQLFREFWEKRDPTPFTPENELLNEYYQRVQYANETFGSFRDGWETDRGEVYIRFGPPSEIERHPFDIDTKPYEIWRYNHLKRNFLFVDEMGYGDYRLVSNLW